MATRSEHGITHRNMRDGRPLCFAVARGWSYPELSSRGMIGDSACLGMTGPSSRLPRAGAIRTIYPGLSFPVE
jgi:hypothetical protein